MKTALRLIVITPLLAVSNLSAVTLYVSLESTNPTPPYATWSTAATNIQQAVDAARTGDTVLVTNGLYSVGQRDVTNGPSRVAITNSIALLSVSGPQFTLINGSGAVRCASLTDGASLTGFTLTNGVADSGGGVWCPSTNAFLTNCVIVGNSAHEGGGSYGGNLHDCTLTGNSVRVIGLVDPQGGSGGGAYGSTLHNCTLSGNSGSYGGGANSSTLCYCTLSDNSAQGIGRNGGGAYVSALYNCTLTNNSARRGGGAYGGTAYDSTLAVNSAESGGGAYGDEYSPCTLYNCKLTDNSSIYGAGGVAGGTLYNCILTGNSGAGATVDLYGIPSTFFNCTVVENEGGISGAVFNSIVYYNSGGNYEQGTTLNYCCTTPLPTNGVGNIPGPPLFMDLAAGDLRLQEGSPCIDAGTNLVGWSIVPITTFSEATLEWNTIFVPYSYQPTDIVGNTRFIDGNGDGKVAWDIGAYEFNSFKPPQFSIPPQLTSQGWKLNFTGPTNMWVRLERSRNLKNWQGIWLGFMGAGGIQQFTDRVTGQKLMFYRAVVP